MVILTFNEVPEHLPKHGLLDVGVCAGVEQASLLLILEDYPSQLGSVQVTIRQEDVPTKVGPN